MQQKGLTEEQVYRDVCQGFGPELCAILMSDGWTDVMVNDDGSVWVDTDEMRKVECHTDQNGLLSAALTLAAYSNQTINEGKQSLDIVIPVLKLRTSFVIPPAVKRTSVDFRRPSQRLITPEELMEWGSFTRTQYEFLKECVYRHRNIVVSGGTGSGKTTLVNSLLTLVDPKERMIIIEDVEEIMVTQPNRGHFLINKAYTYQNAIASCLRFRPDRIIIGECRMGGQTLEMLKAWNTGHPGGFTTIHANNAKNALDRLDQLCSEVSVSSQRAMIDDAIDVVIQMNRVEGTRRKVTELLDTKTGKMIS